MRLRKFDDVLYEKLRDPEYAAAYLEAAKEDGIEEFLDALQDVACAQEGGMPLRGQTPFWQLILLTIFQRLFGRPYRVG